MQNEVALINKKVRKKFNLDLDTKRELAKIGMTASMGITVVSGFYMKNKFMKNIHVAAGVALVGFCIWHHTLYNKPKKKSKKD